MNSQTAVETLDFPSAVDYVRRTVHVADLKVHRVALSVDNEGCVDVDFDFINIEPGLLSSPSYPRRAGRMTVWVERDGKLYGEW